MCILDSREENMRISQVLKVILMMEHVGKEYARMRYSKDKQPKLKVLSTIEKGSQSIWAGITKIS